MVNLDVMKLVGYLVFQDKTINFPILGTLSVDGKTTKAFEKELQNRPNIPIFGIVINGLITVPISGYGYKYCCTCKYNYGYGANEKS